MLRNLLPRNTDFFDLFEKHAALTVEACKQFKALTSPGADMTALAKRISDLEHDADDVTHRCIEELHKTFITPIDRYDIHNLIKRMDDVIDSLDSATVRMRIYEIEEIRPEAGELADVLVRAAIEMGHAITGLRNMKNATAINDHCIALHELEGEADGILRKAIIRLFKEETNTILVIKWKEIFERLEKATDRCEGVANIIEGLVIEST
jgi:uncharacterized protein